MPGTPVLLDILVMIAALFGAFQFTARYPQMTRRKTVGAVGADTGLV
jgi:hypothetical protein